jgi:hypothetical protein
VSVAVEPVLAARQPFVRFFLGIAVPLAIALLASGLWWVSDRLLYVGPLDRAAFGWLVVLPAWIVAPTIGGLVWGGLSPRNAVLAAVLVGITVGGIAATLFWLAVAYPDCTYGAIRMPGDWVLPALVFGTVIGTGFSVSGLLASTAVRQGHPWRAVALGASAEVVMVFAAILVVSLTLPGAGCLQPPV